MIKYIRNDCVRVSYDCGEIADVFVEVLVVHLVHDGRIDVFLQVGQVHDHSGDRVAGAAHGHEHSVVVTVSVGVVAFAVDLPVDVIT